MLLASASYDKTIQSIMCSALTGLFLIFVSLHWCDKYLLRFKEKYAFVNFLIFCFHDVS